MTEYKCLTSVYFEEILYMPGEIVELDAKVAKTLLSTGSIEAIESKAKAEAEVEAEVETELK